MDRPVSKGLVLVLACGLSACVAAGTPSRIGDYVTREENVPADAVIAFPDQQPVQAGLLVISDKANPGSGPGLPEEAVARFSEDLREELGQGLPFRITQIVQSGAIAPNPGGGDSAQFRELGRKHDMDHLAVVVISCTEVEYPKDLDLGGATQGTPGLQRDSYSRAELALLDVRTGRTLMQAEGQGWATLVRPYVPGMSPRYPVVYIRPGEQRRIWPPTWEGAPDTLRVVSFNLAGKALASKLNQVWLSYLQSRAAAGPAEK